MTKDSLFELFRIDRLRFSKYSKPLLAQSIKFTMGTYVFEGEKKYFQTFFLHILIYILIFQNSAKKIYGIWLHIKNNKTN